MKTKFEQFEAFKQAYLRENCRLGQATFNAVYDVDHEIANQLRATDKDSYYFDSRIEEFMKVVYAHWENIK